MRNIFLFIILTLLGISGHTQTTYTFTGNGYWTDSSEFKTFEPGVYTVAAADEWGALAIVHFTVTP